MKMRRKIAIAVALLAMVCLMAAPAFAKQDTVKKMGAVKTDLNERQAGDPANEAGSGDTAGWAIFNTNCDIEEAVDLEGTWLIANIHLHDGMPKTEYDVYVKIDGSVNLVGQLKTNKRGKGNFHTMLDVTNVVAESVEVQAVVKPISATAIVGYATDTVPVPMKDCYTYDGDV
jgi:hypothetical protein